MPRITMLGAGSNFTAALMRDIMLIPELKKGDIRLVDIDQKRLAISVKVVQALSDKLTDGKWSVTGTTERRDVLKGTDYVVNCIEVSGVKCVRHDNDIPLKFGVDQCIGDTIGPGGIFKALRTVPSWLEILADIEDMCPDALVMNYTNPMSIMTLAAEGSTNAQVVGLCHSVQGTSRQMARIAGVPYEKMQWRCGGINHLAWLTELKRNGRDLYPKIFKRARNEKEIYEKDPVRFEIMFHFGAFVTESSGHLSEYVPYFRKRKNTLKEYCRDGYRGGSGFYADGWPNWRKEHDKRCRALAKDITGMKLERGLEYASEIIESHLFNKPATFHGSVLNEGLISNLPTDGVVEVEILTNNVGFNPVHFGKLPPQMAALCSAHMYVYECVVRGIMNKDRDAIYHAMLLDPLNAAVCSPAEIEQMTAELAWAEKRYIPKFMTKGLKRPQPSRKRRPRIGIKKKTKKK